MAGNGTQRQHDDPEVTQFSERMRALRLYWGLTQVELADRCGIPRTAMALVETNRNKGTSHLLRERFARGYGVDVQTISGYISGKLTEFELSSRSVWPPPPPPVLRAEDSPETEPELRKRGRPAGQILPGAWHDRRFIELLAGAPPLAGPERLSYATAEQEYEWELFPNLLKAIELVAEDTGIDSATVEHSAHALALATEGGGDRSTLEWASLLGRHVLRTRSGRRFNPRSLPALVQAIREASASTPEAVVEKAAAQAARGVEDPRALDCAGWLQRIQHHIGADASAGAAAAIDSKSKPNRKGRSARTAPSDAAKGTSSKNLHTRQASKVTSRGS